MRIGILSDTHGFLHPRLQSFFEGVDELWHAGDIGSREVLFELEKMAPLIAVYGNIDDYYIRLACPEFQSFTREGASVLMTHIAGASGRYHPEVVQRLQSFKPNIFVCGHSHILKVQYIEHYKHLYINPGAAGMNGFHRSLTAIRMEINEGKPSKMEVLDIPRG